MRTVFIASSALLPGLTWAQSLNVDFDVFDGGPIVGEGAPSDAFGAAANQPGRWNQINASQRAPHQLIGINGQLTNVLLQLTGGNTQRGGWNNPLNTGDYALLLNDAAVISTMSVTWTLTGLQNGHYLLYVYAVNPVPNAPLTPTDIFVKGSTSMNPQTVTGPMPGNSFQYLITHSIHEVVIESGELSFSATRLNPNLISKVNGFQLVAVPEPISAIGLIAGFVALALRKRRRAN